MESGTTDEIQIDIFRAAKAAIRKLPLILLAMCVTGYIAYAYFEKKAVPSYSSSGKIYVIDKETQEITVSIEDLDIGTRLVEDYRHLITSRIVLEKVIQELGLDITYEELQSCITASSPTDTRVIEISIRYGDKTQITRILNKIENVTCNYLSRKLGTERPTVLERASEPKEFYESSPKKYTLLCVFGIGIAFAGFFGFLDMININIRYKEEIQSYLGLELIGDIPDAQRSKSLWAKCTK